MDPITEYWEAIRDGEIPACRKIRKLLERLASEVRDGCGRWFYDQRHADRVIAFVTRFCRHSKGTLAGQRVELMLWQRAFLAALFGFVDESGERRFKEALLWVARKNGKSLIASAIALYLVVADGENCPGGADVACAATKSSQARIVWGEACNMRDQDPWLRKHIRKRQFDLYVETTRSSLTYVGRDSQTSDGLNLHGCTLDEIHAIRDRNQYEVLKLSMSSAGNRSPLFLMVSTAGTIRQGLADDIYDYAAAVIDGTVEDERFLPWVYEIDAREDYLDPDRHILANPGLGVIKSAEELAERVERSKSKPLDVAGLLTKDFNFRTSVGETAWLDYDEYHNPERFDLMDHRGAWGLIGADLSKVGDLTSAALVIYDGEKFLIWSMSWLPEAALEKHVQEDKIPYDVWAERGLLRLCKGNTIDTRDVTAWANEITDEYQINVHGVWFDAWSAATWAAEMEGWGYDMHEVRQGTRSLSIPMEYMMAAFREGRICYDANPLFEWAVSNVTVYTDANGMIKPDKRRSTGMHKARRIDPLAAALDAFAGFLDADTHEEYLSLQGVDE